MHRWRVVVTTATTALLVLGTATAGTAQDEAPVAPTPITCDGETLDDTDGFLLLAVEPGQTVTCEADGLDPELESQLIIGFFGWTDDEGPELGEDDPSEEPVAVVDEVLAPGATTFAFAVPEDLFLGDFEGVLAQGDPADPSYEEFFGGLIGDFVGSMGCAPDPVEVGAEVSCEVAEFEPGDFTWEVHTLDVQGILAYFLGAEGPDDGAPDDQTDQTDAADETDETDETDGAVPDASGTATADDDGVGTFGFEAGDAPLYLAVAEQETTFAFYVGEILPATIEAPAPAPVAEAAEPVAPEATAPEASSDAPVVVTQQPTRVDAGLGGAAPSEVPGGPLTALLAAAGAAVLLLRRRALRA